MAGAFVDSKPGYEGSSGTTVAAAPMNVAAGALLIAGFMCPEMGYYTTTITVDDGVNTWHPLTKRLDGAVSSGVQIFYAYNAAATTGLIATASSTAAMRYKGLCVAQYSGMDTTSGVLVAENVGTGSGGGAVTSGGLTTSTDSLLIGIASSSNDRSWAPGNTFTELFDANVFSGGSGSGQFQYKLQSGAGTYTVAATPNSGSNKVIAVAAFKVAAGGGGGGGLIATRSGVAMADIASISGVSLASISAISGQSRS